MSNVVYKDKSKLTEAEAKDFAAKGITVLDQKFEPKPVKVETPKVEKEDK